MSEHAPEQLDIKLTVIDNPDGTTTATLGRWTSTGKRGRVLEALHLAMDLHGIAWGILYERRPDLIPPSLS